MKHSVMRVASFVVVRLAASRMRHLIQIRWFSTLKTVQKSFKSATHQQVKFQTNSKKDHKTNRTQREADWW